ncbi:aKG-HExxH-type peptide beta-hydroxylase [Bacillus marinisedimentorum]|uniref:aKG-HExxH-type peptide beta-hydroxylase n=1 Tax=Bacillus marinisedimentorum TaxID=1821260 RepID=UPI001471E06E|nr:HEXXH motif-containing putative peptide modification protein [Bacillus marinisedimentorum]
MENDQIYTLSLRPFSQRLISVIDIMEQVGKIPADLAEKLKGALDQPEFLKDLYSPGLNYFTYFLTTYSDDGMIYNMEPADVIRKMETTNFVEPFMSYFILPCAKHGIEFESEVECRSGGTIEIPGLNHKINLSPPYECYRCTVITAKNEITLLADEVIIGAIRSNDEFTTRLEVTSPKHIECIPHYFDSKSRIAFEMKEEIVGQCLSENINSLNVRKSEIKDNRLHSISFTPNDHLFYESCLNLIQEIWPEYYGEMEGHIKLLAIMDTDAFGGFTTDILPDAIFISHHPHDFLWVTENIIHECAHSRLNQLFAIDPIVMNDHSETYKSPWRTDPRPMKGVFHGAYAFARVAMWLERLQQFHPSYNQTAERLEFVKGQLNDAISVINESGKLSPLGEHIFNEIKSLTAPKTLVEN